MELDVVALTVLIGTVVGFGSYCFTCALHVWRKRNGQAAEDRASTSTAKRLGRAGSLLLLLGGIACVVAAATALLVSRPKGLLHGKDLATIWTPDDLQVDWTTESASIEPGDVLARFRSPESEARVKILRSTLEGHRAARAALQKKPLEPDREITRRLVDLGSERRHLESRLTQLQVEHGVMQRDLFREQLTRQNDVDRLHVELVELQRQVAQARLGLEYEQKQALRSDELLRRGVEPDSDHEEHTRKVAVGTEEFHKLNERIDNVQKQQANLQQGLDRLKQTREGQSTQFGGQIAALTDQLGDVNADERVFEKRLEQDLARAAALRKHELELLDAEIRKTEQELAGLEATLQQTAQLAGHVVYRAPSPQAAGRGDPLLVLGPHESLRLRMRLPRWQRKSLEKDSAVRLELVSQMDGDANVERHFVERWFSGKLVQWRELPRDPSCGLAELSCEPPAEAVRYLASGHEIQVKMHWWPSPLGSPVFLAGIALSVVGAVGWTLTASRRRSASSAQTTSRPAASPPHGQPSDVATEYGAEGAMLHLLGLQFREAIVRHSVDRELLSALEWALDRHRARAVRLIGAELDGPALADPLNQFVDHDPEVDGNGRNGSLSSADLRRLLRIVRTVAPEAITDRMDRLAGQRGDRRSKDGPGLDVHGAHITH